MMDDIKIQSIAELGKIVRQRRKKMGISQADLSGMTGLGNRFIVDLEKGKPTIQFEKVLLILSLLGIDLIAKGR